MYCKNKDIVLQYFQIPNIPLHKFCISLKIQLAKPGVDDSCPLLLLYELETRNLIVYLVMVEFSPAILEQNWQKLEDENLKV